MAALCLIYELDCGASGCRQSNDRFRRNIVLVHTHTHTTRLWTLGNYGNLWRGDREIYWVRVRVVVVHSGGSGWLGRDLAGCLPRLGTLFIFFSLCLVWVLLVGTLLAPSQSLSLSLSVFGYVFLLITLSHPFINFHHIPIGSYPHPLPQISHPVPLPCHLVLPCPSNQLCHIRGSICIRLPCPGPQDMCTWQSSAPVAPKVTLLFV